MDSFTGPDGVAMTPHLADERVTVWHADCLDVLRAMPSESVHAVVCDPPYGLADHPVRDVVGALTAWLSGDREHVPDGRGGFMGRAWDRFVPPPAVWDECYRVLKPGGHLVAFAGSRTDDLMGISIRLAGFEIRDGISWLYGQGMPKSLDVAKAIDRAAGVEPEVVGTGAPRSSLFQHAGDGRPQDADEYAELYRVTVPTSPDAVRWAGWGTALKPAQEPLVVARKHPAGTVAASVLQHGTGALHVAAGRTPAGRWPTNVVLTHDAGCADDACTPGCPVAELDAQSGERRAGGDLTGAEPTSAGLSGAVYGTATAARSWQSYGDDGGASRYYPVFRWSAKATTDERPSVEDDEHETVKPLALMRWIVRLVAPPDGVVLDPFGGSGTTAEACILEGVRCVLVERDARYLPLIAARVVPYRSPAVLARALGRGVTPPRRPPRKASDAGDALFDLGA